MPAFRIVYKSDPGFAELLSVSQTAIIDRSPPRLVLGSATGVACVVGEFETGPIETATEVFGATDRERIFGGLGRTVDGALHAGPIAQQSGGSEAWNGNGFIATVNKPWGRLVIMRVDSSAGEVEFTRLACLNGIAGPYAAANGDTAVFELNGGPTTATATIAAAKATISAIGAAGYPLAPGTLTNLTMILAWDDIPATDAQVVTFADTDITQADVEARINAKLAAAIGFNDGGEIGLQSVREGSSARIQIVGGTALALLALPTAVVNDLWTITVTADTAITTEVRVSRIVNGVVTDFDTADFTGAVGSVTAKRDKLLSDTVTDPPQLSQLGVPGFSFAADGAADILVLGEDNQILIPVTGITALQGGGELTIANTTPGVALEVFGTGNVGDAAQISTQEAINIVDAVANMGAALNSDGTPRFCNELTPGTGSIKGDSGAFLAALGIDTTTVVDANNGPDLLIPAGTRVQDSTATATIWITMSGVQTLTGGGPFVAKVRPFFDTDTALASTANNVTVILSELPSGFTVTNPAAITRLTSALLDARYTDAIRATVVNGAPSNAIQRLVSARSSEVIRDEIAKACREATAQGMAGRTGFSSPRIGSTRDAAVAWAQALREERVQVNFPGFQTAVQEIRETGVTGGEGFADDGIVDVHSDAWDAAIRTIILPEDSAAQDQSNTNFGPLDVAGLESAYDPNTEGSIKLTVDDYKRFKREGIAAPSQDRTAGIGFTDDVTSVDGVTQNNISAANRRAFADFINDLLFVIAIPFSQVTLKPNVKEDFFSQINASLDLLQSAQDQSASRLVGFSVEDATNPAVPSILRSVVRVQMYAIAESIVFETETGPTVIVSQEAA